MRVNISGKGIIPGIGVVAPIFNHETDTVTVSRLLNFNSFRVYDSVTGLLITRKNLEKLSASSEKIETPVVAEPIVETVVETIEPTVEIAEPVIEQPVEINETVEEIPEETVVETVTDTVEDETPVEVVETATEEIVEEASPLDTALDSFINDAIGVEESTPVEIEAVVPVVNKPAQTHGNRNNGRNNNNNRRNNNDRVDK